MHMLCLCRVLMLLEVCALETEVAVGTLDVSTSTVAIDVMHCSSARRTAGPSSLSLSHYPTLSLVMMVKQKQR